MNRIECAILTFNNPHLTYDEIKNDPKKKISFKNSYEKLFKN